MRMPRPKYNHSYPYWIRRTWTLFTRKRKIEDFSNPPDMPVGTQIHDAVEFVKPKLERVIFPEPYRKKPEYLMTNENPDWNVKILHYTKDTRIIEGLNQSLVLFKTVQYKGLSKPVQDLMDQVPLDNVEQLLKRKVTSDYVWDSTQELLPRRVDPEKPSWIFERDYGVTLRRKICGLESQLLNLCSAAIGPAACQRHKLTSPYAKVFFHREGERVLSEVVSDAVLLGSEPLPPMDPSPDASEALPLEDIYPLSPLVDLRKINIYKEGNVFCVGNNSPKRFCHLLLLGDSYEKRWLEKQILARGVAACFTFTASQALNMFGPSVKRLPEPVSVNCILFQEKKLTYLSYQLNTLDLDKSDGVKNQVWIDGPHQLFENYDAVTGELVGFEPGLFSGALALFASGLKL